MKPDFQGGKKTCFYISWWVGFIDSGSCSLQINIHYKVLFLNRKNSENRFSHGYIHIAFLCFSKSRQCESCVLWHQGMCVHLLNLPNLENISWQAITLNRILLLQKDSLGKIIWIYSEHIQRQGTMHSPCEFIIILRLSQAQWIWNANELVRIKKSLWSETSPNLLQDERYIVMAYAPLLS